RFCRSSVPPIAGLMILTSILRSWSFLVSSPGQLTSRFAQWRVSVSESPIVTIVIGLPALSFAWTRSRGAPEGWWRFASSAIFGSRRNSSIVYEWAAYSRQYHHLPTQSALNLEGALPVFTSTNFADAGGMAGTRSRHATVIFFHSVLSMGNM